VGRGSRNRMGGSRFRCKPQIAASARHATCLSFLAAALVVTLKVEALRKMLIDALQKWVTLVAAVLAAFASIVYLWWKYREKSDRIKVGCGTLSSFAPGEFLHVVNVCDHPVRLVDYGYVMPGGELKSLPQLDEEEPDNCSRITYGNLLLETRNASFETGTEFRGHPVGVYAITNSQTRPTVAFQQSTPRWTRYWLYVKVWKSYGR